MVLKRRFPFNAGYGIHILIGVILGSILSFILIVLQPFGTNNFEHPLKKFLLAGYGFSLFFSYVVSHIVAVKTVKQSDRWNVGYELIFQVYSALLGFFFGYIYHDYFINQRAFSLIQFFEFMLYAALPIFPLIAFPNILLRYLFLNGNPKEEQINTSASSSKKEFEKDLYVTFKGENKNELVIVEKSKLVFVKSIDNYVQLYYLTKDGLQNKIIRSTLLKILTHAPFLIQVHRSYLIQLTPEFVLKGNSQKAYLELQGYPDQISVARSSYALLKKQLQNIPVA